MRCGSTMRPLNFLCRSSVQCDASQKKKAKNGAFCTALNFVLAVLSLVLPRLPTRHGSLVMGGGVRGMGLRDM